MSTKRKMSKRFFIKEKHCRKNLLFSFSIFKIQNCFINYIILKKILPRACAAIPILPESKVCMAILNPIPASPNKFSFGILQSSKITLLVAEALIPSLSSFFPRLSPSVGFGTMKALIPLCFLDLSVVANTTTPDAW